MNKRVLFGIVSIVSLLSLIACAAPATQAPAEATAAPPAAEEKVELVYWMHSNPAFVEANTELAKRFMDLHPNVSIKIETFEYDVFIQTLQTSMPAGTEADIMQLFGSWVCSYSDRIGEMPDSVMSYGEAQDIFYAAPLDGYYCGGKLYGLPSEYNIENGAVLVNPQMFKDAGLTYPPEWETTEDLLKDAQAMTVVADDGSMTVSGYQFISGDGLAFEFLAGILQRGGEYWKADNTGLTLDTPEAKETLQEMKSWVDDWQVTDPFLFNDDTNWVGDSFFNNQVAIGFIGPWIVPVGTAEYDMDFDYVSLPPYAGDKAYFAADAGWGNVVSQHSDHPDVAWEFVKFAAANADNALYFNIGTGTVPAVKSVAADPALLDGEPWVAASLEVLDYGRYVGPLPDRDQFWYDIVYPHILAVFQDTETIDEALAAMDSEANATFQ